MNFHCLNTECNLRSNCSYDSTGGETSKNDFYREPNDQNVCVIYLPKREHTPLKPSVVTELIKCMDTYAADRSNKASMRLIFLEEDCTNHNLYNGHECWLMLGSLTHWRGREEFGGLPLAAIERAELINNFTLLIEANNVKARLMLLSGKEKVSEVYNATHGFSPKIYPKFIDLTELLLGKVS